MVVVGSGSWVRGILQLHGPNSTFKLRSYQPAWYIVCYVLMKNDFEIKNGFGKKNQILM